jgi:iron(III) transport system permease protein
MLATTLVPPGCLQQRGLACLGEAGLRSYRYVLFDLAETPVALRGSLVWGTLSAVLVVLLSTGLLWAVARAPRALAAAEWILALPVATPGAIVALGLIVAASGKYGLNLYNTPWIVVAAFVMKHTSLAFTPLRNGLAGISGSLFEAARLSGAGPLAVWGRVALPILRPELLGGFFLVLVPILGELTMSVFLSSPSFRSIGTVLFDLQDYADQGSAAALSVLLVLLVLAANELGYRLSGGRLGY